MDTDEIAPPPKSTKPIDPQTMSIAELEAHIGKLEAEIEQARAVIRSKQSARGAAQSIFRS
jgi:uncharacterized small protein (DUF1192 family)